MRRVLVDAARRRSGGKRHAGIRVTLHPDLVTSEARTEQNLLVIDEALIRLAAVDARKVAPLSSDILAASPLRRSAYWSRFPLYLRARNPPRASLAAQGTECGAAFVSRSVIQAPASDMYASKCAVTTTEFVVSA